MRRRPRTFGGAERIRIYLRSNRQVSAFEFDYALGTNYATMVASYAEDLGQPTGSSGDKDGTQRTFWQDERTRFEIYRESLGTTGLVHSRMTDLTP